MFVFDLLENQNEGSSKDEKKVFVFFKFVLLVHVSRIAKIRILSFIESQKKIFQFKSLRQKQSNKDHLSKFEI